MVMLISRMVPVSAITRHEPIELIGVEGRTASVSELRGKPVAAFAGHRQSDGVSKDVGRHPGPTWSAFAPSPIYITATPGRTLTICGPLGQSTTSGCDHCPQLTERLRKAAHLLGAWRGRPLWAVSPHQAELCRGTRCLRSSSAPET